MMRAPGCSPYDIGVAALKSSVWHSTRSVWFPYILKYMQIPKISLNVHINFTDNVWNWNAYGRFQWGGMPPPRCFSSVYLWGHMNEPCFSGRTFVVLLPSMVMTPLRSTCISNVKHCMKTLLYLHFETRLLVRFKILLRLAFSRLHRERWNWQLSMSAVNHLCRSQGLVCGSANSARSGAWHARGAIRGSRRGPTVGSLELGEVCTWNAEV